MIDRELEFKMLRFALEDASFYRELPGDFFASDDASTFYYWLNKHVYKYRTIPTSDIILDSAPAEVKLLHTEIKSIAADVEEFTYYADKMYENYVNRKLYNIGALITNGLLNKEGEELRQDVVHTISTINNPFLDVGAIRRGFVWEGAKERWNEYKALARGEGSNRGVPWGIKAFDDLTNGMQRGWLYCFYSQAKGGKCLSGNSILFDSKTGRKYTLREVVENSLPICLDTLNTDNYKVQPKFIEEWIESGIKDLYKVTFRDGRTSECTKEHPFFTDQLDWVPLENIDIKQNRVALPRILSCPQEEFPILDDEITVLAYMIADGAVKNMTFSNIDEKLNANFKCCIERLGYEVNDYSEVGSMWGIRLPRVSTRTQKEGVTKELFSMLRKSFTRKELFIHKLHYTIYSKVISREKALDICKLLKIDYNDIDPNNYLELRYNKLKQWFKHLGIFKLSKHKAIPAIVFQFSKKQLQLFIASLWDCDGHYTIERSAEYGVASKQLAEDLYYLLLRLGIMSKITHTKVDYDKKFRDNPRFNCSTIFVRSGKNYLDFLSQMQCNVIHTEKRQIVSAAISRLNHIRFKSNVDTISWCTILSAISYSVVRKSLLYGSSYPQDETKFLNSYGGIKKGCGRNVVSDIGRKGNSTNLVTLANSDILWGEIVSVDYIGKHMTYDLSMDNQNANFVANGVFAHNTKTKHNLAFNQAVLEGEDIMWIAREMGIDQMKQVFDSRFSLLEQTSLMNGKLSIEERQKYLKNLKLLQQQQPSLYIVDIPFQCNSVDIENEILLYRTLKGKFPKAVYLDYANLVLPAQAYSTTSERFNFLFQELHEICRKYFVPIITSVQESREGLKTKKTEEKGVQHIGLSHYIVPHVEMMINISQEQIDEFTNTMRFTIVAGRFVPANSSFSTFAYMGKNYIGDRKVALPKAKEETVEDEYAGV